MVLGGLWHGAGYTYALWGLYHGVGLLVNHLARGLRVALPKPLGWLCAFVFVINGWVIFRSPDLGTACQILKSMYLMAEIDMGRMAPQIPNQGVILIILVAIAYFMVYFIREKGEVAMPGLTRRYHYAAHPAFILFLCGIIFSISLIMTTNDSPFLYFQF
jgi:alginate O-acetyltransferase complex protein AlgI